MYFECTINILLSTKLSTPIQITFVPFGVGSPGIASAEFCEVKIMILG